MLKRKTIGLAIFLVLFIFIFSRCLNFRDVDPRGREYAGSKACLNCHKDIYNSYLHTAHFLASQPADSNTIQGSFIKGSNEFVLNDSTKVIMQKRDSGFYQTSFVHGRAEVSQRFDISFGGVKGQTYAYWFTNELFQLPISYIKSRHIWANSPGYDSTRIAFERAIGIQCFNCHASNIQHEPAYLPDYYHNSEGFDRASIVYSVDCERCHGPAAEHVKFHTDNPNEKKAKYISTFSSLTREQKITMCAVCHSGTASPMATTSFDYKPGDPLTRYLQTVSQVSYDHIDVHGNQRALLASSKCFINSNMDCASCHNVHANERNNTALYTSRCMTCHNTDSHDVCKLTGQVSDEVLKNNCVECHMPALPSKVIIVGDSGTLIHTHHIAVYPEQTRKILANLKIALVKSK